MTAPAATVRPPRRRYVDPDTPGRSTTAIGRAATATRTTGTWLAGPFLTAVAYALARARSVTLQTAGLAAGTWGCLELWGAGVAAIVGGICLLILEWVIRSDDPRARR